MRQSSRQYPLKSGASFLALTAALASCGGAFAGGLPSGGHYVAGKGEIGKAGQSLTVKQSSTTGIINWNSFSIGSKNSVSFNNGSGATLNRVTGGNLSTIAGSLHATGSLYLLNAQGVIVSGTGRVVTGGNFVASSGAISNDAFGENNLRLHNAKAAVINRGTIISGGQATLSGYSAANVGTITAANIDVRATTGEALGGGTIRATGSASRRGHILLISASGKTRVTGDLIARGRSGTGGAIETSGRQLSIGGSVDAGSGGRWLIDPDNLTVTSSSAKTIDTALDAGTSVTLQTTASGTSGPGKASSGPGDIIIDSALSWNTDATLTLDAYRSIAIDDKISVTGAGSVVLKTNDGGAGGDYGFSNGASIDYGTTDHGGSLTINKKAYTLLYSMASLQGINSSSKKLAKKYALATSLNAQSTSGWTPIGTDGKGDIKGDNGFTGTFEGLGHTISNLTVNLGSNDYAGLFGFSGGTTGGIIRDIAMRGGSVTGGSAVGGLVGEAEDGTIINASDTGTVSGDSIVGGLVGYNSAAITNSFASGKVRADADVGGLVGENFASVSNSFATGNVAGSKTDGRDIGGLVGTNDGTVAQSYAMGMVTGSGTVGGLVGGNYSLGSAGEISNSYSTGAVSAPSTSDVGGLVGLNDSGTITSSYWDTQTSGQSASAGGTGRTTAQLQSVLPSGFSSTDWSIVAGKSFPYLAWQLASGTPEIISGTISGASSDAGIAVGVLVNGTVATSLDAMSSGANGYYYELLAPGTISSSGSDVLAYLVGSSSKASSFEQNAKGSLTGFNLAANTLQVTASATSETALLAALEKALGTHVSGDYLYTSAGAFTSGADLDLNLSAASFSINHAIDIGAGTLKFAAAGTIAQSSADAITAKKLAGHSVGAAKFTSASNAITDLGSFSTGGAHNFSLTDDHDLVVDGTLNAGSHDIALTTKGSGHDIAVHAKLEAGTVNLVSAGKATESSAGAIVASLLNVTADTGIALTSSKNKIKKLGTDKTKSGSNNVNL